MGCRALEVDDKKDDKKEYLDPFSTINDYDCQHSQLEQINRCIRNVPSFVGEYAGNAEARVDVPPYLPL